MIGFKNINEFTLAECQEFLHKNGKDSILYDQIYARKERLLREQEELEDAMFSNCITLVDYQEYNNKYPCGRHIQESRKIIERSLWEQNSKSRQFCQSYVANNPNGEFVEEARKRLSEWKRLSEYQKKKKKLVLTLIGLYLGIGLILGLSIIFRAFSPWQRDFIPNKTHQEEYTLDQRDTTINDASIEEDSSVW